LKGWKFKYLQDVECPAELPIEMTAFKTQQARWAKGLIQTGKKILPQVMKSDAPWHTKLEAWYHLTANISYPLMIVLSVLLMPAMIIPQLAGLHPDAADRPAAVCGEHDVGVDVLPGEPEGAVPQSWYKTFLYVPVLMALGGVGLTISNAIAVIEALVGKKSAFCAHTQVPRGEERREGAGQDLPQAAGDCAVD